MSDPGIPRARILESISRILGLGEKKKETHYLSKSIVFIITSKG
jgi:hypothetical protein